MSLLNGDKIRLDYNTCNFSLSVYMTICLDTCVQRVYADFSSSCNALSNLTVPVHLYMGVSY